ASWGRSGTSRIEARVFGAMRCGGTPWRPRASWWRTWMTPAAKSTSSQLSPSTSGGRIPVDAPVTSGGWGRRGEGGGRRAGAVGEGGEGWSELCAGEGGVVGAEWVRSLVALEPVEWMGRDVAAAKREREDAAEGAENPLDRPQRKPVGLQLARESDDIVGRD